MLMIISTHKWFKINKEEDSFIVSHHRETSTEDRPLSFSLNLTPVLRSFHAKLSKNKKARVLYTILPLGYFVVPHGNFLRNIRI